MIEAKLVFICPCSPEASIIVDPILIAENENEIGKSYVRCCRCGAKYAVIKQDKRSVTWRRQKNLSSHHPPVSDG